MRPSFFPIWLFFGSLALLLTAYRCSHPSEESTAPTAVLPPQHTVPLQPLTVALRAPSAPIAVGEPIPIAWTVSNPNADSVSFCHLNTPAAPGPPTNFFAVLDERGYAIPYLGGRALYRGTARARDYTTLPPHGSLTRIVEVYALYQLRMAGTYRIRFAGGPLNRLPRSAAVAVRLE